jgi:hypothetical protein
LELAAAGCLVIERADWRENIFCGTADRQGFPDHAGRGARQDGLAIVANTID